ncbi:MAG: hypothetical protein WA395_11355 [Nitrososphaeraceae archaeon]
MLKFTLRLSINGKPGELGDFLCMWKEKNENEVVSSALEVPASFPTFPGSPFWLKPRSNC